MYYDNTWIMFLKCSESYFSLLHNMQCREHLMNVIIPREDNAAKVKASNYTWKHLGIVF